MTSGDKRSLESPLQRTRTIGVDVALTRYYSLSPKGLAWVGHRESEKLCMHGHFVTPRGCRQMAAGILVVEELQSLIYRECVLEKLSSWSALYLKRTF